MRTTFKNQLWIGHAGDLLNLPALESNGIDAVVQVAIEERLPELSRHTTICHIPIRDGANDLSVLSFALEVTASLVRNTIPTLICCSAGMSRSPSIAAGAIALADDLQPTHCLQRITHNQPHDVSPAMWDAVLTCVARLRK